MPRKPIGEKAMTDAERQARYRVARAADAPVIRTRRPADHRSRARRWQDAVAQLSELQAQYADWLDLWAPGGEPRAGVAPVVRPGVWEPLGATRWLVLSVRRWKVSRVRSRVGSPRSRVRRDRVRR